MRYLTILIFLLGTSSLMGQSEVVRETACSGGAYLSDGFYTLSSSYGQLTIATLTDGQSTLTQGFQQPDRNPCLGDFNNDGVINTGDLTFLLGEFGCSVSCTADMNGDGVVNTGDLTALLGVFGTICP